MRKWLVLVAILFVGFLVRGEEEVTNSYAPNVNGGGNFRAKFTQTGANEYTLGASASDGWRFIGTHSCSGGNGWEKTNSDSDTYRGARYDNVNNPRSLADIFPASIWGKIGIPGGSGGRPADWSVKGRADGDYIIEPQEDVVMVNKSKEFKFKNGSGNLTPTKWRFYLREDGPDDAQWTPSASETYSFGVGDDGEGIYALDASIDGQNVEDTAVVTVFKVDLKSVDFKGTNNYTLKKQGTDNYYTNDLYADEGNVTINYPEWQDTNLDGISDKTDPVCYKIDSTPSMTAVLNIKPPISAVSAKLKVKSGSTTYSEKDISLSGSSSSVSVAWPDAYKLTNIGSSDYTFSWALSVDDGENYDTINSTQNEIFKIFDTPVGNTAARRVSWVTGKASSSSSQTKEQVVDKIWSGVINDTRFGSGGQDGWTLLDGGSGDCDNLARLMKYAVELIGAGPAEVKFVRASTDSGAGNCLNLETRVVNNKTQYLIMDFDTSTGANWNAYEGCCDAAEHYYAVSPSLKATNDYTLLSALTCDQYWVETEGVPGAEEWRVTAIYEKVNKP